MTDICAVKSVHRSLISLQAAVMGRDTALPVVVVGRSRDIVQTLDDCAYDGFTIALSTHSYRCQTVSASGFIVIGINQPLTYAKRELMAHAHISSSFINPMTCAPRTHITRRNLKDSLELNGVFQNKMKRPLKFNSESAVEGKICVYR